MKIGNNDKKRIIIAADKVDSIMASGVIPSGDRLRAYFDLYDLYRSRRVTHLIPRGAKNTKWRLIDFLVRRMNLSCRLSTDAIAGALTSGHQVFNGLVFIALDNGRIVSFHADHERYSWMMPIRREFVSGTVNKRAIADFFDQCRASGVSTAAQYVRETRAQDLFRPLLDLGMAA